MVVKLCLWITVRLLKIHCILFTRTWKLEKYAIYKHYLCLWYGRTKAKRWSGETSMLITLLEAHSFGLCVKPR